MKKLKNLFPFALILFAAFGCTKSELPINSKSDLYGLYNSIDTAQNVQSINFSDPYILLYMKDSTRIHHFDYQVFDNRCFDGSGTNIFDVVYYKGRELKILDLETFDLLEFKNKY